MMGALRERLDAFWGRGSAAITVPSMDGALRPNSLLDHAPALLSVPEPDNLADCAGQTLFSCGAIVFSHDGKSAASSPAHKYSFDKPVACLAGHASGALAVGMSGEIAIRGGAYDRKTFREAAGQPLLCPTALAFDGPDALVVCLGSASTSPEEWKRDLLQRNASGSVWRFDLASGSATRLAGGLGYPNGLLPGNGGIRISEAWRHRVLTVKAGSEPQPLLEHLPGYPARMSPSADGGSWLCVFAPRRQMVEFVLRERGYRERMMREVHPDFWMAPTLRSGRSFLEPIQGGAVKHLGISKPWAPTLSYGLVIRLDASGSPMVSLHSRADGVRHGVTSCLELGDRLLVASKGGGVIVSINLATLDEEL